jgi:hypothetical protein
VVPIEPPGRYKIVRIEARSNQGDADEVKIAADVVITVDLLALTLEGVTTGRSLVQECKERPMARDIPPKRLASVARQRRASELLLKCEEAAPLRDY